MAARRIPSASRSTPQPTTATKTPSYAPDSRPAPRKKPSTPPAPSTSPDRSEPARPITLPHPRGTYGADHLSRRRRRGGRAVPGVGRARGANLGKPSVLTGQAGFPLMMDAFKGNKAKSFLWNLFVRFCPGSAVADGDDGEHLASAGCGELAWCRSGRGGRVCELSQEAVDCGLAVVDGGSLIVGERDRGGQPHRHITTHRGDSK